MGKKYFSILLMLILVCISATPLLGTSTSGSDNDVRPQSARTPDNDNSFGTATELFNNSYIKGTLDTNDDVMDFFKVKLRRINRNGDLLKINLSVNQTFGAIILLLVNPEMYEMGYSYCYETPFQSDNPIYRDFIACDSGFYYLILYGVISAPGTSIKYDLKINFSMIQRNIDTDNTNATANTAINGGSYPDSIHPVNDYLDLYNIDLTAGTTTTEGLNVELLNTDDKYLAVYNPDGTLREYSDITMGDPLDKEIIKFAADQTGTYRIAVGISDDPAVGIIPYLLTTDITTGIPPDNDSDEEHATRVYDGTRLDTSFDSEFDVHDYYVIELNSSDNLTVSILFTDNSLDLDIEIYELGGWQINDEVMIEGDKGIWTWGEAESDQTDYYINVQNYDTSVIGNYTIWFSLSGENVLFWDEPMSRNNTNLDFSMPEDSSDSAHVNLTHIFYDPDSPLTFASPSHPIGAQKNISVEILPNGTVRFKPKQNYFGYEIVNFSAKDTKNITMYWEVNVTVQPVNDPPVLDAISNQVWLQGTPVNLTINVTDVDDSEFTFVDNTTLFNVEPLNHIKFTPTNSQVGVYHINITVSDGEYNDSVHFTAEILNVNDPPYFVTIGGKNAVPDGVLSFQATEDTWFNMTVNVSDIDHEIGVMDVFFFASNTTDPGFLIDPATGNISFLPQQVHVDAGSFNVKINVTDGSGGSALQNLSFLVQNVNDAPGKPVIKVINQTGLNVICSVDEVTDEDGDNLTYSWDFGEVGGKLIIGRNANYTYNAPGKYTLNLTVNDGHGGISRDSISLNITALPSDGDGNESDDNDTKPFTDTDADGLDDLWELENFGNLSQGPNDDFDNDGFTNLQEFENKTSPVKNTDRPIEDKDQEGDDEKGEKALSTEMELFMYIVGIIGIINLVLVLVIIGFLVMRKRSKSPQRVDEGRVPRPGRGPVAEGDEFMIPCPECGKSVPEDAVKCPYCGEPLELGRPRYAPEGVPEPEKARWEDEGEGYEEEWEEEGYYDENVPEQDEEGIEEPEEEWEEEEQEQEWEEDEEFEEPEEPEEPEEFEEDEGPEWEEEEDMDDQEYYEAEEVGGRPRRGDYAWDEEYYNEGGYDRRDYPETQQYRDDRYYRDDSSYRPSNAWGRDQDRPAWDSGKGARRLRDRGWR